MTGRGDCLEVGHASFTTGPGAKLAIIRVAMMMMMMMVVIVMTGRETKCGRTQGQDE